MNEKFYKVSEIAKQLNISRQGIDKAIRSGKLKAVRIGKVYRVRESDFRDYIQRGGDRNG